VIHYLLFQSVVWTNIFLIDSVQVTTDSTDADSASMESAEASADSSADAPPSSLPVKNSSVSVPLVYPVVKNTTFSVGEKLTFKVRYGFIRAGAAVMEIKGESTLRNRRVYHIQTRAKSASGFDFIYKVEDVVDSFIDQEGLFSWKFQKRLREGGYKADLLVDYYPQDSLADVSFTRYKGKMKVYKQQNYQVKTPPFVLDVLASLYYVRTQPLEVGKSVFITNHDNRKIYELEVRVHQRDTVETEAGKFRCLLVEPVLKGEGIFKQKGRLKVWLTEDRFKIPVQMTSEIAVGHITTELEKIEGLPTNVPARLKADE
jgi:hypothetical protein